MFARIRKYVEIEVLIAIASAVFGLLISPLFEAITSSLFDTPTRALLSGVFFLAILIIVAVMAVSTFARRYEKIFYKASDELSSINRRLGLTVEFVHDPPKRSAGKVYRAGREIIEKAESEILVLHFNRSREREESERGREVETAEYRDEREKYTRAILDRLEQCRDNKIVYKRVMQFAEGRDVAFIEERVGKRWMEHTTTFFKILEDYPDAGYIKKASLFFEQTYVIVDRRYVIWGIDAIDPEHDVRYMEGALFFDDPNQEFVKYLVSFFERIDAHAVILQRWPKHNPEN